MQLTTRNLCRFSFKCFNSFLFLPTPFFLINSQESWECFIRNACKCHKKKWWFSFFIFHLFLKNGKPVAHRLQLLLLTCRTYRPDTGKLYTLLQSIQTTSFFHFALQKKHFRNSQNVIVLRFVCLSLSHFRPSIYVFKKKEENFHFGLNRHSLNLNTKQQQQQEAHQKKKKKKSTTKEE